jgi:hypothetical protein
VILDEPTCGRLVVWLRLRCNIRGQPWRVKIRSFEPWILYFPCVKCDEAASKWGCVVSLWPSAG